MSTSTSYPKYARISINDDIINAVSFIKEKMPLVSLNEALKVLLSLGYKTALENESKITNNKAMVEIPKWHEKELEEAVKEADAGDFASGKDIEKTFNKILAR